MFLFQMAKEERQVQHLIKVNQEAREVTISHKFSQFGTMIANKK